MITKKLEKIAKDIICSDKSMAVAIDDRYFLYNSHRILETETKITEIQYNLSTSFDVAGLMDQVLTNEYFNHKGDFVFKPITHDLTDGIRQLAGRRYSERVIWTGAKNYPSVDARWIKQASEALKAKQICFNDANYKKSFVYLFENDDFNSKNKIMMLPTYLGSGFWVGFYNQHTKEHYNPEEKKEV